MNEELTTAIDELRRRPTDRTWFIPILLSECEIPDRSIGGGETLRNLQAVTLYGWDAGMASLLRALQPGSDVVFRLMAELKSTSARTRSRAADALRDLGTLANASVPILLELLFDDNDTSPPRPAQNSHRHVAQAPVGSQRPP
jgi:hypothetical protein